MCLKKENFYNNKVFSFHFRWASDVELTGNIPNFIGNWTRLQEL